MTSPGPCEGLLYLCLLVLLLGAGAAGGAAVVRALPWPKRWLERKPLVCPICLGGWGSLLALVLAAEGLDLVPWTRSWEGCLALALGLWGASTALAALVLAKLYPPPFELPEPVLQANEGPANASEGG